MKDALVFELSKVERPEIRERMVSHLLNIDADLAANVADGLGLVRMPKASPPAREVITDLPPSPALSILENGPESFEGRKVGVLVTDGFDARLLNALKKAVEAEGATFELVAPKITGVTADNGTTFPVKQKVNGGPSVLFDAVVILPSADGAVLLSDEATAKDFVSDAFAHAKFIAYVDAAEPLLQKAGIIPDGGCLLLEKPADAKRFVEMCGALRFWEREPNVHAV